MRAILTEGISEDSRHMLVETSISQGNCLICRSEVIRT